jgi:S-adenosylmethionine-diacylglycerol 3-amino-3-carboxypropyl transferase
MFSETPRHAGVESTLLYAQCWEDADALLAGLDVQSGDVCLSIASAGDNTLSLLTRSPSVVIAVDRNPAQIAALELRVAAFRALEHGEVLELIGCRPSRRRACLYARCRRQLSSASRVFWDSRPRAIVAGIGGAGRFERYFSIFRSRVLPLAHRRATVRALLEPRSLEDRRRFYHERWDTLRWRAVVRLFVSRPVLGRLGRDPSAFRYANGSVAMHLEERVRHAFAELDPSRNPYLAWILTGEHGETLPHALRAEHFETIRGNLDRLEWHCSAIERLPDAVFGAALDRANLSNVFEYLSPEDSRALLERLADRARPRARSAYWNMMVDRRGAEYLPERLRALPEVADPVFRADKAFFYRDFVVEEVRC